MPTSSVNPDTATAALDGQPTAPATVEVPRPWNPSSWTPERPARMETYEVERPDGTTATVTRNIETGESTVR